MTIGGDECIEKLDWVADKLAVLVNNPLTTALFITICIIVIMLLIGCDHTRMVKLAFYVLITTAMIMLLNNHIVCKNYKKQLETERLTAANIVYPGKTTGEGELSYGITADKPEQKPKIRIPSLHSLQKQHDPVD